MKKEEKKRVIVHISNLPPEVLEELIKKYPDGWRNHIFKVNKPNNEFFHAVTVDTEDASYLVKADVKIDNVNAEKLEEQLFSSIENSKSDLKIEDEVEDTDNEEETKDTDSSKENDD